jgi:hypothetical protein
LTRSLHISPMRSSSSDYRAVSGSVLETPMSPRGILAVAESHGRVSCSAGGSKHWLY